MRILYVEDNEINQALVERVMRLKQHTVLFREDGEGALALLAEDPTLDLILLDIELAGAIGGLEVIQTLRARGDQRPVVAVTAYAMSGDRERFLEAGCAQYLPKPLNIADLLATLDAAEAGLLAAPPAEPGAGTAPTPEPSPPSPPAQPAPPGASLPATDRPPGGNGRAPVHEDKPA